MVMVVLTEGMKMLNSSITSPRGSLVVVELTVGMTKAKLNSSMTSSRGEETL